MEAEMPADPAWRAMEDRVAPPSKLLIQLGWKPKKREAKIQELISCFILPRPVSLGVDGCGHAVIHYPPLTLRTGENGDRALPSLKSRCLVFS